MFRLLKNRSLATLVICQVAAMSIMTVVLSTGVSISATMFATEELLTLPITAQILGTFLFLYPASFLSGRYGRKVVFIFGALVGIGGAFIGYVAISGENFWLFCFAMLLIGLQNASAQYFRFAAMEVTEKKDHASAISLVLLGGVFAAFIGPSLAVYTKGLFEVPFLGVSIALFGLCLVQVVALALFYKQAAAEEEEGAASDEPEAVQQGSRFNNSIITAMISGALGFGIMTMVMNATPIAAQFEHGMNFDHAAEIIKWHIFFMYLPSFMTGKLIDRFGFHAVCLIGCAFFIASALIPVANTQMIGFVVGLVFLGIGWNFTYIGGSYFLGENTKRQHKSFIQGTNDTIIFAVNSGGSFLAAVVLAQLGWLNFNAVMLIFSGIIIMAVLYNWFFLRKNTAVAETV